MSVPVGPLILGSRGTGNEAGAPAATSITPTRRVLDVSEKIHLLDNDNNPLVIFTKKAGRKETVNPHFRWMEDRFEPKTIQLTAATLTALAASGTTVTLPTGQENFITVGDLVTIPGSAGAAPNAYDEVMLATAVDTTGLIVTVVRNFSTARAAAWTGTPAIAGPINGYLTGTAFAEGSNAAVAKSTKVAFKDNFTEIFKDTFSITGTEDASELYGGPDRARLRRKKGMKHMRDIERAFLIGQPNEDVTTYSYPTRTTGGATYWIQTNVKNPNGTINYQDWVDFAAAVFRYGESHTRLLLCSAEVITALDMMANNKYFAFTPENVYGVAVKRIMTSHGDFLAVRHKQFSEMGLAGFALALDMQDVRYRFLRGRDSKFEADIQLPGADVFTDQYTTEAGLEFPLEEKSGLMKGVTGFAP